MKQCLQFLFVTLILIAVSCDNDPAKTPEWTRLEDFPGSAVDRSAYATLGSKGYVVVNWGDVYEEKHEVWEFDPTGTGAWIQKNKPPMSGRLGGHFSANEKLYVLSSKKSVPGIFLYEYNAGEDSWKELGIVPFPGCQDTFGMNIGAKGYLIKACSKGEFWEYDPETNEWHELPLLPGGIDIRGLPAFVAAGRIYASRDYDHTFWMFDPPTKSWTPKNPQLYNFDLPSSAAIYQSSDKIYIVSGDQHEFCDDLVQEFNVATEEWRYLKRLPTEVAARRMSFAFQINNTFYFGAGNGCNYSSEHKDVWTYKPEEN